MLFSLRCFVLGHDDWLSRSPERLRLRCDHCGRTTGGWALTRAGLPSPQPETPRLRRRAACRAAGSRSEPNTDPRVETNNGGTDGLTKSEIGIGSCSSRVTNARRSASESV